MRTLNAQASRILERSLIAGLYCLQLAGCAAIDRAASLQELGTPLSPAALAAIDTDLAPTGLVPPGRGSVAEGRVIFAARCASCHGTDATGVPFDALAPPAAEGPVPPRLIGRFWPEATTLYDYIRRAMPQLAPGSLRNDEAYALTAYLLHRNGLLDANASVDGRSLRALQMPARTRFIWSSEAPEP